MALGLSDMPDDSASDSQPPNPDETPQTEEGQPEPQESVTIPAAMLQGKQFKAGDEIVLKVVAVGDDGIEAEYANEPAKGSGEEYPDADSEIDHMGQMEG